jgi:hypothetical protein
MVETITPVVHGGRRSRWAAFLALHVAGATFAAAAFGAALGGLGWVLRAPWGDAGLAIVVAAAGAYHLRETRGLRLPVPQLRRQVPLWWRSYFPLAPAAFLYGIGLGVGFVTYLLHGTLVVVATAAIASGDPLVGVALLAPFGLVRGATAIAARGVRSADASGALVERLARLSDRRAWTFAHAVTLSAVVVTGSVAISDAGGVRSSDVGAAAAASLTAVFGAAAFAKVAAPRRWRRAVAGYGVAGSSARLVIVAVPVAEGVIAALPLLGLRATAGLAALAALAVFSIAILVARVRGHRRLACGCFGNAETRDYRSLLVRNALLGAVAVGAWTSASDGWVGAAFRLPRIAELVPAAIVGVGIASIGWLVVTASIAVRRGRIAR